MASCCRAQALEYMGFSSYGTLALLPHGMWDLPRPRIKPVSPALTGRFLTIGPPGKSSFATLEKRNINSHPVEPFHPLHDLLSLGMVREHQVCNIVLEFIWKTRSLPEIQGLKLWIFSSSS